MMELIWISTAYLTGLIASRLSFPPLVGYLVAGYVLSRPGDCSLTKYGAFSRHRHRIAAIFSRLKT